MWLVYQLIPIKVLGPKSIVGINTGLFLLGGLSLAVGNKLVYGFPLESAFKVMVGMLLLGLFVSSDLALCFQLQQSLERIRKRLFETMENTRSLINLMRISAFALVISVVTVFLLMMVKDLEWVFTAGESVSQQEVFTAVLLDAGFLLIVVLAYAARIIYSYSKNLELSINNQVQVLDAVAHGYRDRLVPVVRNDELGVIARQTNEMIETLKSKEHEIVQTRDTAIVGLASLAEARDNETGAHILRTQHYVRVLAEWLKHNSKYAAELNEDIVEMLFKSAPLHDIGKVGIPDHILLKPGPLTPGEFEIMKTHTTIGVEALRRAEQQCEEDGSDGFLGYAGEIAENHHEKWDGSGYPKGLIGEDIPLSGRLMAVADVYDALISKRHYKEAFSHDTAKQILVDGSGSHFDPEIIKAFAACETQFTAIAAKYEDSE